MDALCKALKETEAVAVVRRVYQANSAPIIGALIPVTEGQKEVCEIHISFTLPGVTESLGLVIPACLSRDPWWY